MTKKEIEVLLSRHQIKINMGLPVLITAIIFYSGNLGQRISEIETAYVIDTNTLNNSFITLSVNASTKDDESFQKTKNALNEQMEKFNKKYASKEKERMTKMSLKTLTDRITYTLIFLQIVFNGVILNRKMEGL